MPEPSRDPGLDDGLEHLRKASAQLSGLAEQVERGQAETPLRDHFQEIVSGAVELTIILYGVDAASRSAALAWFSGDPGCPVGDVLPDCEISVRLAERGYRLEQGAATREFDELGSLCEALAKMKRFPASRTEPARVSLAAPRGLRRAELLILGPGPIRASQVARLGARSVLLVVSGPAGFEPEEPEADAVRGLAEGVRITWPIVCGLPPSPFAGSSDWRDLIAGDVLAPARLDPRHAPLPLPPTLVDDRGHLRRTLHALQGARSLQAGIGLLDDWLGQEIRGLEARRRINRIRLQAVALAEKDRDRRFRETGETVRRRIEEGFARIEESLGDRSRDRASPSNVRFDRVAVLLKRISPVDLHQDAGGRTIHLSLSEAFHDEASLALQQVVREDLREDLDLIADGIRSIEKDTNAAMEASGAGGSFLEVRGPDEDALHDQFFRMLRVETRYRGELPRRGWMERISHGRRPVMIALMTSSLAGQAILGQSGNTMLRNWLSPTLLALFVVGLAWTFYDFAQESHERLSRELMRLKDSLPAEFRRAYDLVCDTWRDSAGRFLRAESRELARKVEELLRDGLGNEVRLAAEQKDRGQALSRSLEQRGRDLNALAPQVQRLRQVVSEASDLLEGAVGEALRDATAELMAASRGG